MNPSEPPRRPSVPGPRPSLSPQAPGAAGRPSLSPQALGPIARASQVPRPRASGSIPPGDDENEVRLGSSDRTQAAGDALRALARTSRSYLIYDAGNQAVRGFIEDVRARFQYYFDTFGDMELQVRPYELMLDGEAVYLERDRERSLSLKLFRDGVRKLSLARATDWGELARLLEILSIRFVGVRLNEDDVVTLLWKAGFVNIRIESVVGFVPEDEEEDDRGAPGGPTQGGMAADRLFGSESTRVGDVASSRVPHDFDLPAPVLPRPTGLSYQPLPEDALEALRAEADSTRLPEVTLQLVNELLLVVANPTDPMVFEEIDNMVREVRDFLLAEDRLDMLLGLFDNLASYRAHRPADADAVTALLQGFVDPVAVRRLIRSIPKDATEPPERLHAILSRVPGDVLAIFFDLLETERDEHSRAMLRHLIAGHLPARTLAVITRFRASPGPVAADLLRVLVVAAPEAATEVIGAMQGSDSEVQHEFLRLAVDMPGTASLRALLSLLLHAPSLDVRTHTLDVMARRGERGAFGMLQRFAETRADGGAQPDELAAAGRALARLDPSRALPLFVEWAQPKGFFNKLLHLRPLVLRGRIAVAGLGALGSAEAQATLQEVVSRGEVELREVAREALAAAQQAALEAQAAAEGGAL